MVYELFYGMIPFSKEIQFVDLIEGWHGTSIHGIHNSRSNLLYHCLPLMYAIVVDWIRGCLFSHCVKPIDWFCLLLPPTLMLPLIVLICPWTERLEELSFTSGLLWPSLRTCSVGSQSAEPETPHSQAHGCMAARQRCDVVFFLFF